MPHARFNWAARPLPANDGRFALGDTWKLSDTLLTKGECTQGCTLEVLLEHQSKASQLQIVCNATALELKVALKMAPEYKWLVQIRGTPLPNEPDLYYFRTPEELSTSKVWRLRVKFLFSSPNITTVRLHSLSLSFDKLTKRGGGTRASGSLLLPPGVKSVLATGGSSGDGSTAGDDVSSMLSGSVLSGRTSPASIKAPIVVVKGDEGKSEGSGSTSTTASLSTSPTGSSTPTYDDATDMASLASSLGSASVGGYYSDARAPPSERWASQRQKPSTGAGGGISRKSSSSSLGTAASSASREKDKGRRKSSGGTDPVIQNLVSVIDSVVLAVAGGGASDKLLVTELLQLRSRVSDRSSLEDSLKSPEERDAEMAADIQRITCILATMMSGPAASTADAPTTPDLSGLSTPTNADDPR